MKGLCKVTYVHMSFKNKEGVLMNKYQFTDPEGYRGVAFAPVSEELKVGDNCLISLRCYMGKWYAKHIEVVPDKKK